jgi:hypothetical protein
MFDSSCIIFPIQIDIGTSCPVNAGAFFDVSKISGSKSRIRPRARCDFCCLKFLTAPGHRVLTLERPATVQCNRQKEKLR